MRVEIWCLLSNKLQVVCGQLNLIINLINNQINLCDGTNIITPTYRETHLKRLYFKTQLSTVCLHNNAELHKLKPS